jgi:hypothetical protein
MSEAAITRRRELLEELQAIETQDHPVNVEQRRRDTLEAMRQEERAVQLRLHHAKRQAGEREQIVDHSSPTGYRLGRSGHEMAAGYARRLAEIDTEISRLESR